MSNDGLAPLPLRRQLGQFAATIPDRNIVSLGSIPTALLLPPANLVPLALGGMLLSRYRPRLGRAITITALLVLLALGLPIVSALMMQTLQAGVPRAMPEAVRQRVEMTDQDGIGRLPGAIVVLSADATYGGGGGILPQPGLGMMTLERVHAASILARRLSIPVLVTGGQVSPRQPPLAVMMAQAMQQNFGVTPAWLETRSTDTWENAEFSVAMLKEAGISSIYLVTNAWHMPRSLIAFRHFGIEVVPVPSRFTAPPTLEVDSFAPRVSAWLNSYFVIHEWIGIAWYRYRDRA